MKLYAGIHDRDGKCHVHVVEDGDSHALKLRRDLRDHNTNFAWGYGGSGPAQLALAILADALDDDARAVRLHQRFKFDVIVGLEQTQDWDLTHAAVLAAVYRLEKPNTFAGTQ
jgi:hypothetical protein